MRFTIVLNIDATSEDANVEKLLVREISIALNKGVARLDLGENLALNADVAAWELSSHSVTKEEAIDVIAGAGDALSSLNPQAPYKDQVLNFAKVQLVLALDDILSVEYGP